MLQIKDIFVTQRKLKRLQTLTELELAIVNNECIEPIEIFYGTDGSYEIKDGHHRLAAYYLTGKRILEDFEFELLYIDSKRPRFGNVNDLLDRTFKERDAT